MAKYPDFIKSTGYGTGAGLCGWNCRHSFHPFFPGIDKPSYTDDELAHIDPDPIEYNGKKYDYYACTQKQRSMETAMRKTKRDIISAKGAGDDDRFTEKSILLRRQREEYANFSKKANMLTQNERAQVYGFDRSISSKSTWAAKKAESGTINPKSVSNAGKSGTITGKAVNVYVPAPADNSNGGIGKLYRSERVDKGSGSGIIKAGSENVTEIIKLGKINTQPLEKEFGKIKTDEIIITNERIDHIKQHHPEDYQLFEKYVKATITAPDIIIKDENNIGTVFMIKRLEDTNLNVVARLVLTTDNPEYKNSVMTFYRIREKNLNKIKKHASCKIK